MAKFKVGPYKELNSFKTVRLGSAANAGGRLTDADVDKFVKLAGDSQYNLCAAGDPIEGWVEAIESATQDAWSIGTVGQVGRLACLCDGLEATPGVGVIAVGDYVVCGTIVAAQTAMTSATGPKVCKATNQPGATVTTADNVVGNINAAIANVTDAAANSVHPWRVVSIGVGGAVGDTCIIERVSVC